MLLLFLYLTLSFRLRRPLPARSQRWEVAGTSHRAFRDGKTQTRKAQSEALSAQKWSFTQNDCFLVRFEKVFHNNGIVSLNICIHAAPLKITQNSVVHIPSLHTRNGEDSISLFSNSKHYKSTKYWLGVISEQMMMIDDDLMGAIVLLHYIIDCMRDFPTLEHPSFQKVVCIWTKRQNDKKKKTFVDSLKPVSVWTGQNVIKSSNSRMHLFVRLSISPSGVKAAASLNERIRDFVYWSIAPSCLKESESLRADGNHEVIFNTSSCVTILSI